MPAAIINVPAEGSTECYESPKEKNERNPYPALRADRAN